MNTAILRRQRDDGFSLVELITVILIIGLLAAIAIPLYLDQQKKGRDAAAKSDLNAVAKGIRIALDQDQVGVPTLAVSDRTVTLDGETIASLSPGVVLGGLHWTSFDLWCIDVTHPDGDHAKSPGYKFNAPDGDSSSGQCT
ncbi:type IV pilin protein [Demequina sp.]|uniref:type IV pilin protein n=1 Tax=Demequina sp. TaxID=2050685 RepID=UPI0025C14EB9|nr:prepilin-type N-terminal cleavage/methylation domain-containing protein [Demequina sp.]